MNITTDRLILRNFSRDDIDAALAYLGDADTMYYIEDPFNYEQAKEFVERNIDEENALVYALIEKKTEKIIGHMIFHEYNYDQIYELGFIIKSEYQGKGYGYEIGKALLDYGFHVLNLHKIIAETIEGNNKSISLIEKLGFTKEATLRKQNYDHNQWVDEYHFGLLKSDYN
ncbi:MAG TPA: GNAT family protein [Lachnospiraceae bacterium]|nr:GNAT family protein [Lachnospiraceae bacterium]